MKKRKLFTTLLTLLLLFVFIAPTMAKASEVTNGVEQTGTLTLHKFEYSNKNDEEFEGIPGTGMEVDPEDLPGGITPLAGVLFRVTRVADDAVLPNPAALVVDNAYMMEIATNAAGLAVFATLPMGRYFVHEVSGPANITTPTPDFLIDIPMMNIDRINWNWNVHVYPKNETKYGTVELTKTLDGNPMLPNKSATFELWADKEVDVRYPNATTTFTTDEDGIIVVSGLPMGDYYFIETIAPLGYALDNRPVMFRIDEHSYLNEEEEWENLEQVSMDDEELPTVDKYITTVGQKLDSGGYADPVTWIIKPSIPNNIGTYTSFVITDPINPKLDFITGAANLVVTVDGLTLERGDDKDYIVTEPFVTNQPSERPVPNNLVITFTAAGRAKLAGKTDLEIRFETYINTTAVMGELIPNSATVTYNNGFGQTGTATVPNTPKVWTGGYKFHKINDETPAIDLMGAEFKVYKVVGETKWYFTGTAWSEDILNGKVYTSNEEGLVDIKGLPAGTYFLLETKAPMNTTLNLPYNLLRAPIEFTVTQTSYAAAMTNIINKMGPKIPQTGGIGTLLFSVIGLGLMGSAVMISRKKSTR